MPGPPIQCVLLSGYGPPADGGIFIVVSEWGGMSFDLDSFFNGHVPEAAMIAAALVAFLVIYTYRQDDEGDACKASVLLGLIVGVLLLLICLERTDNWNYIDKILVYLL